ncbi:ABC transporter permease [Bowmanella pacifica]|uniref:ABC macrolide family export system permease 2 n=1 Tax=Bowmanella pacifica TaxID=502051 RepID=A0A918DFR9_9ALTE|nr:ABC transporter permease [Bowmanella pacifica]GGO64446.1 ABC macrolide family export system permease 2 [Bowmanella pacifica]
MFVHYIDLGWRSLKRTPVVSLLMLLAIAIGIGITMTSLSVYHMMSVNPMPHKNDQLFAVQLRTMDQGVDWWTPDDLPFQLTYQDAMNLRKSPVPFRQAAMLKTGFGVKPANPDISPFIETARAADSDFFAMYEVPFAYGAPWDKAVDLQGEAVAVIGAELNQKLFGGGNNIGKDIVLDSVSYRIIGILKAWKLEPQIYDLNNGAWGQNEQLFIPFSLLPIQELKSWGNNNGWKYEEQKTYQDKLNSEVLWLQYKVELADKQAQQDYRDYLAGYIKEQQQLGRFQRDDAEGDIKNIAQWLDYRQIVSDDNKILVGLSFMFLAVCLANILSLLLAKFLKRAPEIGVRRALGASKTQVFAQHLVEVGMLGLAGGALGLVIAQLGLYLLRSGFSRYEAVAQMDLAMWLAAPTISLLACLLAGCYPAWKVCRTTPALYLKTQ